MTVGRLVEHMVACNALVREEVIPLGLLFCLFDGLGTNERERF
jgi:hypothetical protein